MVRNLGCSRRWSRQRRAFRWKHRRGIGQAFNCPVPTVSLQTTGASSRSAPCARLFRLRPLCSTFSIKRGKDQGRGGDGHEGRT